MNAKAKRPRTPSAGAVSKRPSPTNSPVCATVIRKPYTIAGASGPRTGTSSGIVKAMVPSASGARRSATSAVRATPPQAHTAAVNGPVASVRSHRRARRSLTAPTATMEVAVIGAWAGCMWPSITSPSLARFMYDTDGGSPLPQPHRGPPNPRREGLTRMGFRRTTPSRQRFTTRAQRLTALGIMPIRRTQPVPGGPRSWRR
jgi:hypothetical protein